MSENKLENFKTQYEELRKKHSLVPYRELNQNFQIDRAAENETDLVLVEIRKIIADKLSGYLRFLETLLNPTHAPMFVFSIIKTLSPEDKKNLSEIYKELAKNEFNLIKTDTSFSEKKEAEFIINSYNLWKRIKKDILRVLNSIEERWDTKIESNNKGYFG